MKRLSAFSVAALILFSASPLLAQRARTSPHETISAVVDKNRVTIVYGRPYTKDPKTGEMRKIWGTVIPFGKIWRTGADEATLFITQQPLSIGGTTVPAGAYTLWTWPNEDGTAKLIINKQIGQWGIDPREPSNAYDEKQDLLRVDLKKDALEKSVDQFTIALGKNPDAAAGGGLLKLSWENTQYSVPYTLQK